MAGRQQSCPESNQPGMNEAREEPRSDDSQKRETERQMGKHRTERLLSGLMGRTGMINTLKSCWRVKTHQPVEENKGIKTRQWGGTAINAKENRTDTGKEI